MCCFIFSVLHLDCRSMLYQVIEPKPKLRLPLSELAQHSWITKNGSTFVKVDTESVVDKPLQAKAAPKIYHINFYSKS